MKNCFNLGLLISILLWAGCDVDRYTGYDTSGQPLMESIRINGQITNRYTNMPVYEARVNIDGLENLTDYSGAYSILFLVSEDINRNKPVSVHISAENYFDYETEIELTESGPNNFDFRLKYAAPIIENAVRVWRGGYPPGYYCQAIITDYQGFSNIKKVTATFPYKENADPPLVKELAFNRPANGSPVTGYYMYILDYDISLDNNFTIDVEDHDGYTDSFYHAIDPMVPDELLFNPF